MKRTLIFSFFFTNVKRMKKKIANQLLKANFWKLDSYLILLLLDIPVSRRRRHILELEADSEVTIMILLSTQKTCLRMLKWKKKSWKVSSNIFFLIIIWSIVYKCSGTLFYWLLKYIFLIEVENLNLYHVDFWKKDAPNYYYCSN